MKLALCNRAISRNEIMAIHAAGCSDVARTEVRQWDAQVSIVDVASIDDAVNLMLDAETRAMGWNESALKVYPCCKGAK